MSKYYLAYGSNLNIEHMKKVCPYSTPIGPTILRNYRLAFKGTSFKSYLTIEPCEGSEVPVGIFKITSFDESRLDFYEVVPTLYSKETISITYNDETLEALIYIMNPMYSYNLPSSLYISNCLKGYQDFKLDPEYIENALTVTKDNIAKKLLK